MKKASIILSLSAIICVSSATAQSVAYKVVDRADSLSPLKISLAVDLRNLVMAAGSGLTVEGVIRNRFSYSAKYVKYFTSTMVVSKDNIPGADNIRKGSDMELGAEWYFASMKAKDKKVKVTTSSNGYVEHYFNAKLPRRCIFMLRGGVNVLDLPTYIGSGNDYHFMSGADSLVIPKDITYYSNSKTTTFYAGIGYRKLYKAKVKADDGWGYFKWKSWKMYLDLLSGTTAYDNVRDVQGKVHSDISISNDSKIGYRLGMEEEMMGVTTNIEVGKWPGNGGIYSFYNYLNLSFRFNVYGGDKRYRMKGR